MSKGAGAEQERGTGLGKAHIKPAAESQSPARAGRSGEKGELGRWKALGGLTASHGGVGLLRNGMRQQQGRAILGSTQHRCESTERPAVIFMLAEIGLCHRLGVRVCVCVHSHTHTRSLTSLTHTHTSTEPHHTP